jgi:hypothetical protein
LWSGFREPKHTNAVLTIAFADGHRMPAERLHLELDEGLERQTIEQLVQFRRAVDIEDPDVAPATGDAPKVPSLQFFRNDPLTRLPLIDILRREVMGDSHDHLHMKKHDGLRRLCRWRLGIRCHAGQRLQLFPIDHRHAKLLRFRQFAAGALAGEQVVGF